MQGKVKVNILLKSQERKHPHIRNQIFLSVSCQSVSLSVCLSFFPSIQPTLFTCFFLFSLIFLSSLPIRRLHSSAVFLSAVQQSSPAVISCMYLNRHTSLPKAPASWTGTMTFLCQCGRIYRHDSLATLQFQLKNLMRQQEHWAAVGASWCGSEPRVARCTAGRLWPPHTVGLVPLPGSIAGLLCCISVFAAVW